MANQIADPEVNLEELTVAELKDLADEKGVQVTSHMTKDEIIKAIEKHDKNNAKANANSKAANGKPDAKAADAKPDQKAQVEPFVGTGYQPPPTFGPVAPVVPAYVPNPQPIKIADLYGNGAEYQLPLNVLQLGASQPVSGKFLLDNIPPGMIVQLARIKNTAACVGSGGTLTAQLQDDVNTYGGTLDVTQPPADANMLTYANATPTPLVGHFSTPTPIYLVFSGTGILANLTAGAVTVWVHYTLLA